MKGIQEWKGIIIALIAGISAVVCISIFSRNLVEYKKTSGSGGITATGSANCDFESDLIVWRGSFSTYGITTKEAYAQIKSNAEMTRDYLLKSGVTEEEMVFNSVNISQHYTSMYDDNGEYVGEYADGYDLYQQVCVTSTDIDKVEKISRDITQLIESGVEFSSDSPAYYYTKMDELKLQLIEEATQNAKQRIDIMAEGTGGKAGKLLNANLGVFQITAQNSDSEYSYGGSFDTSSRNKTASITVKLNYGVD